MPSALCSLEHRSLVTRRQAHDRFDRYQAIRGGFANSECPRLPHKLLEELIGATQGAGQIGADLHAILASLLVVVKRIKANDLGHIGGR